MSKVYMPHKRHEVSPKAAAQAAPQAHTPSMVSGESRGDLDAMMQQKIQQHFLDNQISSAESEADRIAASVSGARTPEEVKQQLGEKMGADFSGVKFHTDAASASVADTMGARAYTSGNDVYFGKGGFDAGVAAHELVHTVQQGVVGSSMQTVSAPTGGVQMKAIDKLKSIGRGIKTVATLPFKFLGAGAYHRVKARAEKDQLMYPSRSHPLERHYMVQRALKEKQNKAYTSTYNYYTHSKYNRLSEDEARARAQQEKDRLNLSHNPFKRHKQKERLLLDSLFEQQECRDAAGRGSIWDELEEEA